MLGSGDCEEGDRRRVKKRMSSRRRKQTEMDCCGTGGSEKAEEGHYGIGRAKSAAYDARKKNKERKNGGWPRDGREARQAPGR